MSSAPNPQALIEAASKAAGRSNGVADHGATIEWLIPGDLWAEISPTPELPRGLLPASLEAFAFSKPETFNPAALAAAALATCSIAASDFVRLVINPTWRERFCIWVGLYGPSSAAKTPTTRAAFRPLEAEQQKRLEEFDRERERFEAAKKTAKADGTTFDDPEPIPVRYHTHSATLAAVTELEKNMHHGIGLVHDELSSLVSAMDGVYKERSANERGDWLALYDGGPFYSDRILRGQVFVKNHSATILGGITTDKLARFVRDSAADGLMSRMSLVSVPVAAPSADLGAIPLERYRDYSRVVERIVNNRPMIPCDVTLSEDGREELGKAKERWQQEAALYAERLPRYSERLGKLTGLAARVALGFAIIESAEVPAARSSRNEIDMPRKVDAGQMRRACAYVDYQARHDLAFYAAAAGQDIAPTIGMARRVAGWILQWSRERFHLGDLTRGILEWRSLRSSDQLATLELLDHLGWVRPDEDAYFRGQQFVRGVTWTVNPRAHQRFELRAVMARRVAEEAKRRLSDAAASTVPERQKL
jgi:hypothetical protein